MAVVSLGLLGATELEQESILYAIVVAFLVNITWGLIDGISVMHSRVIDRAKTDQIVFNLRAKNNDISRKAAMDALDGTVAGSLGEDGRNKVIELISAGAPGADPSKRRYYPGKEDWYYAIGILVIDVFLVIPLIVPLLVLDDKVQALYISQLIATVIFAALGVAYAKNLHRNRLLAALFLGTLCFSVFTLAFLAGW